MSKRVTTQELADQMAGLNASIETIAQALAAMQPNAPADVPQREASIQKKDVSSMADKIPERQVLRRREGAQASATKWGEPVQMYVRQKADGKFGVAYCKLAAISTFEQQPSFISRVTSFKDGSAGIITP